MSTRIEKAEAMQRAIATVVAYMDCEGLNINNLPQDNGYYLYTNLLLGNL